MKRLLFLLLLVPGLLEAQTVTITGDGAATTVELTGPTGPAGSMGPTGPQGPAGPAGGTYAQVLFSALGTPADGTSYFCTDCLETDPCAGSGTGAFAFRVGSVWSCAKGGTGNMADPGADGFMVRTAADTSVARTLTSPLGTLAIGNTTGVAGNPTLDVDTSIMGQFATGAGSFGGTCTPGDWYYETDTFFATFCPVTDTGYTVVSLPHASGTPTDDNTLVGSGTAWAKKAIPDCDDAGGSHLNYDTATNAFSCGTSGAPVSGGSRPNSMRWQYIAPANSTTFGSVGGAMYAAGSNTAVAADANDGFMILSRTGATTGNHAELESATAAYRTERNPYMEAYATVSTTADIRYWIGFTNTAENPMSATGSAAGMVIAMFRYSSAVPDTNWQCVTNDIGNDVGTVTDSGVAVGTTGKKFAIAVNVGVDVKFYIDGTLVCTNTTNLPTTGINTYLMSVVTTLADAIIGMKVGYLYGEVSK
jgi:hypothetical protein